MPTPFAYVFSQRRYKPYFHYVGFVIFPARARLNGGLLDNGESLASAHAYRIKNLTSVGS